MIQSQGFTYKVSYCFATLWMWTLTTYENQQQRGQSTIKLINNSSNHSAWLGILDFIWAFTTNSEKNAFFLVHLDPKTTHRYRKNSMKWIINFPVPMYSNFWMHQFLPAPNVTKANIIGKSKISNFIFH